MTEAEKKLTPLKSILETIRERADYALKQLAETEEERSMRWRCKDCGWIKHFTRPVPLETASGCPRCKSTSFEVVVRSNWPLPHWCGQAVSTPKDSARFLAAARSGCIWSTNRTNGWADCSNRPERLAVHTHRRFRSSLAIHGIAKIRGFADHFDVILCEARSVYRSFWRASLAGQCSKGIKIGRNIPQPLQDCEARELATGSRNDEKSGVYFVLAPEHSWIFRNVAGIHQHIKQCCDHYIGKSTSPIPAG